MEIYRNSEGAFDIVADGPRRTATGELASLSGCSLIGVGDYWYHSFDIVADGPSDVPPQGNWPASQNAL